MKCVIDTRGYTHDLLKNTVKVKPETLDCRKRSNGEGRRLFWLWW